MNPFQLLKALFSLANSSGDKWTVSVNKVRKGPVKKTFSKLNGGKAVLDFQYEDAGTLHRIEAVVPLTGAGAAGGGDEIKFDGAEVEQDDLLLSNRFVFPQGPILVVEFKFQLAGEAMRIRFDGRMM